MSSTTNEWTKGSNRDLDGQTKNFENFISIEYLNLQMGKIRLPHTASCGQKDRPREGDLFCYSHPQKWVPYAMYFAHILLMKFYWDLRPKIRLRLNRSTFGPFVVEVGDFSWFQINLTYIVHLIQFLIILFWLFSDFWSKRSPSEFKKIVLDTQ